jgi:hypothetical protein|tara:strand:- start:679 stop:2277 length:1599 start_codon:yes stop_codon:yes gene_type:complete
MEERKLTLKQRRWTTPLNILRTKEKGLDQRVADAYNQEGIRIKHNHNSLVFTDIGFLKYGKKGFPLVGDQNDNWYLLQPNANLEPGNIYNAGIDERAQGFEVLGRIFKRQHELSLPKESSFVVYKRKCPVTLEDALKFQKYNVPVYEGATQEFVNKYLWGIIKRPNPVKAKITTDGEVKVAGTVVISPEDYRALSDYLFKKGQPPSKTIDRLIVAQQESDVREAAPSSKYAAAEKYGQKEPVEDVPEGPKYLTWLEPKTPPKQVVSKNSAAASEVLSEQERFDTSIMPPLKGIEGILRHIAGGDFKPEYVSTRIYHMEQVPTGGNGKKGTIWIAYPADPVTGKMVKGFYVIQPDANDIVDVEHRGNGKVEEISPPRPILHDLKYWPNHDVDPREVKPKYLWYTGADNDMVIEGLSAVPVNLRETLTYETAPLLGVVGMRRETWRNMLVKMVANGIIEDAEKGINGFDSSQFTKGLPIHFVKDAAISAYSSSEAIKMMYLGGPGKFANSVAGAISDYKVGSVEERQLPLTPLK